ncbi:MAG: metallophosphoesterase [Candidatus Bathyarchaeota archaeon]|nr:metallophosphoesterase [Candidatus Bathyarchaeota archaeon]
MKGLLIGIIADTHDNLPNIDRAVKRLNEEGVEIVLHAGDYVAPFAVQRLKGLKARLIGVFGNNDGDRELLKKRFSENERFDLRGRFAQADLELRIALVHGDEEELLRALMESGAFDVIVHGHTHVAETYRKGRTLIINPGEVCGYLSGKATIAVLDTASMDARIIEI